MKTPPPDETPDFFFAFECWLIGALALAWLFQPALVAAVHWLGETF